MAMIWALGGCVVSWCQREAVGAEWLGAEWLGVGGQGLVGRGICKGSIM